MIWRKYSYVTIGTAIVGGRMDVENWLRVWVNVEDRPMCLLETYRRVNYGIIGGFFNVNTLFNQN